MRFNYKEKAKNRNMKRYFDAREHEKKKNEQLMEDRKAVQRLVGTKGWQILLNDFKKQIKKTKNDLLDTNSFRIWETTRLKAEIKAKEMILHLMEAEEIKAMSELIKGQSVD